MVEEHYTVVALPYSCAPHAKFHVALFISPDLTPDGETAELGEFWRFMSWADALLNRSNVELYDQDGQIEVQPLLTPLSPSLWSEVFPPSTPVRGRSSLEWSERKWRTFRAAEVHNAAKLLHAAAILASPTRPPTPTDYPLVNMIIDYLKRISHDFNALEIFLKNYDESTFTAMLDQAVGEEPFEGGSAEMPLEAIESAIDAAEPFQRLLLNIHRARRFYERPEALMAYRERPVEGLVRPRPEIPEQDFHERCALIADHPILQRQLGLVLDLNVPDHERLGNSQWLAAYIELIEDPVPVCRPMRTKCAAVGDDLITVPATTDWLGGRLWLGNRELYSLLDLDPDGTALKLDRFLWGFPRLLKSELNKDPVHAAPSSLRSIGFTVVRNRKALDTRQKLTRQQGFFDLMATSPKTYDEDTFQTICAAPLLTTEDINQGLRVEVWDDEVRSWFSPHRRRIDVMVNGSVVATGSSEEGFLQGTTATETPEVEQSPVHVHESVFGWEGWSLSAPRPGKRIHHENGKETMEEVTLAPGPVTPLSISSSVEPGTLPRLRYGRSYAFRAWGVDLAGNSREHLMTKLSTPGEATVTAVANALEEHKLFPDPVADLEALVRPEVVGITARSGPQPDPPTVDLEAVDGVLTPAPEADQEVLSRLRSMRVQESRESPTVKVDRARLVADAVSSTLADSSQPLFVDTVVLDAERVAHAVAQPGQQTGTVVLDMLNTVTPLKPFLRWDPVQPPAVVARHAFSSGESLRQLVIRSGVTQDLETLEITVTPPELYAPDHESLRYRETSERHLAPPKTSQTEAELHGAFDGAIGSQNPDRHLPMLAVALREAGTFFDMEVPLLDDPSQQHTQEGIGLAHDPGVDENTLASLPLGPGLTPATGQYVIHDTDQLVLPYLPDCAGRGISFVFQEAGVNRQILPLFASEGFTAGYHGEWPELEPFRLKLCGTELLTGAVDCNCISIGLPPGDIQRFRLASSLDHADLDIFGLWRSLPEAIRTNSDVAEAVSDGWLWAFTPFDDVTLVHAVPRPLVAPTPTRLVAWRPGEGATDVLVLGAVTVDGPSTDSLTVEARWTDPVDDLSMEAPFELDQRGIAFTTRIRPEEDLAVLGRLPNWTEDTLVTVPGAGRVWVHIPVHQIGDTKHRTVHYRFRAATRFLEYFDSETLAPSVLEEPAGDEVPVDDGRSVVGPEVSVSVPSSAMPAAPVVHSVLPLFRWDSGTEPEQPMAVRHRRRAGVRIYLERPWFSSGEDELLGVLVAPQHDDTNLDKLVSQWGADPVWLSAPVENRALYLELDNLLRAIGLEDEPDDALPVTPPRNYNLGSDPKKRMVTVLGYRPQFSKDRQMWYVDVAIDPGKTFWPFVRLSVARYQPDSRVGCHLSKPVRCDFVQLTPERTTSVSRTDIRHVRVVLSGPVGVRKIPESPDLAPVLNPQTVAEVADLVSANRTVTARLQRRVAEIPTDLGWENVAVVELPIRGFGRNFVEVAWVGELEAPEDLPLRRPGALPEWRVVVEEWESLLGDPETLTLDERWWAQRVWEQRLIFADEIIL